VCAPRNCREEGERGGGKRTGFEIHDHVFVSHFPFFLLNIHLKEYGAISVPGMGNNSGTLTALDCISVIDWQPLRP
jgi:hypothetical protein